MHKAVVKYCQDVKRKFPDHFKNVNVLDCGSLDINGNNRYLFENSNYTGIDILLGKNVDHVSLVHKYDPEKKFDTIISTEMLEHDQHYRLSIKHMIEILKPGGLILITAAGKGRKEHGTKNAHPKDSPLTHDFYRNLDGKEFLEFTSLFTYWEISQFRTDIRFAAIKE